MPAQVSHSLKPEYGNLAMRGTLVQSHKGGVPIQLPNKYGYLLDGSREPMSPSSAPAARWNLCNNGGLLQCGLTFRVGINPTVISAYRENGQLHLNINLQSVSSDSARREPDGPVYMNTQRSAERVRQDHQFFRSMPLEIPPNQAPYKPTHENVLIGTGSCTEFLLHFAVL